MSTSISYSIIRSFRKTMAIQIHPRGEVIVRAPFFVGKRAITRFVGDHVEWIRKRLATQEQRKQDARAFSQTDSNGPFLYLGQEYPFVFNDILPRQFVFDGEQFVVRSKDKEKMPQLLNNWYKKQARNKFEEKLWHFAEISGVKPQSLKLSSARTRWGSCSSVGNINLNWKLILTPEFVIDYVIWHELMHLKVHGHNKKFWDLVAKYCLDFKEAKKWLRQHQERILAQ